MPHTDTDDTAIFYEVVGGAADPVIVLVSGGGAQLLSWRPEFLDMLVAEGFRVVRMDNRDTGLSARFGGPEDVDGGYTVSDMADDVMRVLDHLEAPAAHVVGHSMGGIIAQTAALDHPDRILSLGLISTIPGRDERYILHPAPDLGVPPRYTREQVVAGTREYARPVPGALYPLDQEWLVWAAGEAYDRGYAPDGFTRQWAALYRAPERLERLRGVTVPTLVLHGRDDDVLHWSAAVDLAQAMPHAELQVHPGMGHLIPRELWPELVAGVVRAARASQEARSG